MKICFTLLLLIIISSCNNSITKKLKGQEINSNQKKVNHSLNVNNDSILIEKSIKHTFSDILLKDEFKIVLKGSSLAKGLVYFTIKNSNGDYILNEKFPANLLLNYDFQGNFNSTKEIEKFIKKRVFNFFNDENFYFPAIKEGEEIMEDYVDKNIWEDVKSDTNAIGFYYLIGEEDGRKITYSKKNKKIVMYYNCC